MTTAATYWLLRRQRVIEDTITRAGLLGPEKVSRLSTLIRTALDQDQVFIVDDVNAYHVTCVDICKVPAGWRFTFVIDDQDSIIEFDLIGEAPDAYVLKSTYVMSLAPVVSPVKQGAAA